MQWNFTVACAVFATLALSACTTVPARGAQEREGVSVLIAGEAVQPTSLAGAYLAASFAVASGDIEHAAEFYFDMLQENPQNEDLLTRSFIYSATVGDMNRALPLAAAVLEHNADNSLARLIRAIGEIENANYVSAEAEISQSRQGAFTGLINSMVEAWALAGQGRIDEAIEALDDLLDQRGGVTGLHAFHTALILDYSGRRDQAADAYTNALETMGMGPRIIEGYARFLRRNGDIEQARELYSRYALRNPANSMGSLILAEVDNSEIPLSLIATPADGVAEGLFALAASLTGNNGRDIAILYLNLTLYLQPDFELARVLLGERYERMGQLEKAIVIYDGVAEDSPYHTMIQVRSAIDEGQLGRIEQAIAKVQDLTREHGNDVGVWTALGDLQRGNGDDDAAAAAYDRAIGLLPERDPRLVTLYYARGIAHQQANRWDQAERDFQGALVLDPDRADVLNYLGYSWIELGKNLDQAVTMLELARELRPRDGYIADSVGWAYYKLGRYDEAVALLEEAVLLVPEVSEINDHLGDAYWRVGRRMDARFEWNHALSLEPEPEVRPIVERKLQLGLDAALASEQ